MMLLQIARFQMQLLTAADPFWVNGYFKMSNELFLAVSS
jgi:hypothetical protein